MEMRTARISGLAMLLAPVIACASTPPSSEPPPAPARHVASVADAASLPPAFTSPPRDNLAAPDAAFTAIALGVDAGAAPAVDALPPDWLARHGIHASADGQLLVESGAVRSCGLWRVVGTGEAVGCFIDRDAGVRMVTQGYYQRWLRVYLATGATTRAVVVLERVVAVIDSDYGKGLSLAASVSSDGAAISIASERQAPCLDEAASTDARAAPERDPGYHAVAALDRAACKNEGLYRWAGGAFARVGPPLPPEEAAVMRRLNAF